MFAAERQKKIKEILLDYKHIDVNTLCSLLDVSIATVRRDLDRLEQEKFLKKEHGGAILIEGEPNEVIINIGSENYSREKRIIGRTAADMIEDGEAIFIGSGETCTCLSQHINQSLKNLIVVTNNINVVLEMVKKPGISVLMLGGDIEVLDNHLATYGMYAHTNIKNMYIDKAFISSEGATIEEGYTLSSRRQAMLNKIVIEHANETIMLADYTKFGKRAFVPLASLDHFKRVVSNIQLDEKYKEYFYDRGVKVFMAYEERMKG